MNILGIDTTSAIASAAIMGADGSVIEVHNDQKMNHLQNLMTMIDELLSKCQLQLSDITHIAVSEGPGSFTGIRIGIATGKMLAQVLGVDMVQVETLKAYAYAAKECNTAICPMLDARRSQVYAATYKWENGRCIDLTKGGAYMAEEMKSSNKNIESVLYIGDGSKSYQQIVEADNAKFDFEIATTGLGKYVCEIAKEKIQAGEITNLFEFKPVYMRLAEAQRKLEETKVNHN